MKKITYWIPSLIIASIIFFLSSRQKINVSDKSIINFIFFKSLHILEYGIFLLANYRATYATLYGSKTKAGLLALLLTVCYAVTDEIHQTFVPTREGRPRDVGFDTIGASAALFFIWNLLPRAPKKLIKLAKNWEII